MARLRVALLQVPMPHSGLRGEANIPHAAGYLIAYSKANNAYADLSLIDPEFQDRAGDSMLISAIESMKPDILGLSLYAWNSSRSLDLAKKLKRRLPGLLVVGGGPEVMPDNGWLLAHSGADLLVSGEGESPFLKILQTCSSGGDPAQIESVWARIGDGWKFNPQAPMLDLSMLPSPYLEGILDPTPHGFLRIETMRGCTFKCGYCNYHHNYPTIRTFDLSRVRQELEYALERKLYVEIIDSVLSAHSKARLSSVVELFIEINKDQRFGVNFTERAEFITPELADAFARAGVKIVQVGLQSANPEALKAIQRQNNIPRFLSGLAELDRTNVGYEVGIIIGLPKETIKTTRSTFAFLKDHNLIRHTLYFPLSVLPGTRLRERAGEYKLRYLPGPPYNIVSTDNLSYPDIQLLLNEATEIFARRNKRTFIKRAHQLPWLTTHSTGAFPLDAQAAFPSQMDSGNSPPVTKILLDLDSIGSNAGVMAQRLVSRISATITLIGWTQNPDIGLLALAKTANILAAENPHTVMNLVIKSDKEISLSKLVEMAESLPLERNFLDNINCYSNDDPFLGPHASRRVFALAPWGSPFANSFESIEAPPTLTRLRWIICRGENSDEALFKAALDAEGEGVLVAFGPNLNALNVKRLMENMAKNYEPRSIDRIVQFENVAAQAYFEIQLIGISGRLEQLSEVVVYLKGDRVMIDIWDPARLKMDLAFWHARART